LNKKIKRESAKTKKLYTLLFEEFLHDLEVKNARSEIFTQWADIKDATYINKCRRPEIVRDFLSSLTDDYFIGLFERKFFPRRFGIHF
jgi:dGTP triphosphohydrolase